MDQSEKNEELQIDLGQLFSLLKKNLKLIIASTVVVAVLALAFTYFLVDKKYASTAKIFITPKVTEGAIDSTSLNSNKNMVNNYIEMLQGETILIEVAKAVGEDNFQTVKNSLSISNPSNSEMIDIKATTKDATLSQQIVHNTITIFFQNMKETMNIENLVIVDNPKVNDTAVSPNIIMNTLIGAMLGLMGSCGVVFITYLFDKRLRTREEAENFLGIPVLVEVPWFQGNRIKKI